MNNKVDAFDENETRYRIIDLYPHAFCHIKSYYFFLVKWYNMALMLLDTKFRLTLRCALIPYIGQSNPYNFSFTIPRGWLSLLADFITRIRQSDEKNARITKISRITQQQGTLVISFNQCTYEVAELANELQQQCQNTCSQCGLQSNVGLFLRPWKTVLCHKHALDYYKNYLKVYPYDNFYNLWRPNSHFLKK